MDVWTGSQQEDAAKDESGQLADGEQRHHGEERCHHVLPPVDALRGAHLGRVASPPVEVRRPELPSHPPQTEHHPTAEDQQHHERDQSPDHAVTDDLVSDEPP